MAASLLLSSKTPTPENPTLEPWPVFGARDNSFHLRLTSERPYLTSYKEAEEDAGENLRADRFSSLPLEIIEVILMELPPKSLLSASCACRRLHLIMHGPRADEIRRASRRRDGWPDLAAEQVTELEYARLTTSTQCRICKGYAPRGIYPDLRLILCRLCQDKWLQSEEQIAISIPTFTHTHTNARWTWAMQSAELCHAEAKAILSNRSTEDAVAAHVDVRAVYLVVNAQDGQALHERFKDSARRFEAEVELERNVLLEYCREQLVALGFDSNDCAFLWEYDLWCECNSWDIDWDDIDINDERFRHKLFGQDEPTTYDGWLQLIDEYLEEDEEDVDEERKWLAQLPYDRAEFDRYTEWISRTFRDRNCCEDDESVFPDDIDLSAHETCLHPPEGLLDFWDELDGFRADYQEKGAPPFDSHWKAYKHIFIELAERAKIKRLHEESVAAEETRRQALKPFYQKLCAQEPIAARLAFDSFSYLSPVITDLWRPADAQKRPSWWVKAEPAVLAAVRKRVEVDKLRLFVRLARTLLADGDRDLPAWTRTLLREDNFVPTELESGCVATTDQHADMDEIFSRATALFRCGVCSIKLAYEDMATHLAGEHDAGPLTAYAHIPSVEFRDSIRDVLKAFELPITTAADLLDSYSYDVDIRAPSGLAFRSRDQTWEQVLSGKTGSELKRAWESGGGAASDREIVGIRPAMSGDRPATPALIPLPDFVSTFH